MKILAIETSCDETAAAVTEGRKILSSAVFSQINIHKKYGGVYPFLAKREHIKKIQPIIDKALKNANIKMEAIDAIAVTFGQGLVVSLEVGLNKAKELAEKYQKPLIPVDHTEGHIYSSFAQNSMGNPKRNFKFPFLALIVSGGFTGLILAKDHLTYEIIGKTLDDAAGEALDKAAKMMGLAYPGGPILEKLAKTGNPDFIDLPIPMWKHKTLDFSFSGLKSAFKRKLENFSKQKIAKNMPNLAASFQTAVFGSIEKKLRQAIDETDVKLLVVGSGVFANSQLRSIIRKVAKENHLDVYLPYDKKLYGDNAGMIGVVADFKYKNRLYLKENFEKLERVGRPNLTMWVK